MVQYSRGHAQQGAAPTQEGRHPQAYGALPDLRDKYLISYSEGREVPPPHPRKNTVVFKVLPNGAAEFDRYIPVAQDVANYVETL